MPARPLLTVGVFYRENSRYSRVAAIHYVVMNVVMVSAIAELAGIVASARPSTPLIAIKPP